MARVPISQLRFEGAEEPLDLEALYASPGLARHRDPDTSHQAAQAQRGGLSALILEAFQTLGPMSDDALAACLSTFHAPSIKTARSRLSKADLLVDTGETCLSARGCAMVVWRLA